MLILTYQQKIKVKDDRYEFGYYFKAIILILILHLTSYILTWALCIVWKMEGHYDYDYVNVNVKVKVKIILKLKA